MPLKIGTPVHCVELNTGSNLTGTLSVSEQTMRVDIHSYDKFFLIRSELPVFLKTAEADTVSLHSNITGGTGHTSRLVDQKEQTYESIYHQEIVSNIVLVGNTRWEEADKIKRVHFKVNHIDHLLRHRRKIEAISAARSPGGEHFLLFRDAAKGMKLSAWYAANYNTSLDSPQSVWPTFEIEFDVPVGLHDYVRHLSSYVSFLSLLVGVRLAPREIHIDRLSFDEMKERVETHSYPGNHRVHYVWAEDEITMGDTNGFGSPVRAYDDDALVSLRAVLISWMDRADEWRNPYQLMMGSFSFRHVVSPERLINACRWLEEIPKAKPQNSLQKEELAAISAAATEKAAELGHPEAIQKRIENAIGLIRLETSEERFSRLVGTVKKSFGEQILPTNVVDHLTRAIRFRGKAAHGHFEPDDDTESQAFYKSMRAMEALCLLLTVRDLPISEQGRDQISSHPLVEGYFRAYE
ncbi:hypothetical protein QEZ47_05710 [Aminobacter anthyllidis]|uniref:hypothetical protein n=1 Tax=Aminobacter anthyllidis TaxID=1035067 RepID=UPI002455573D|nr:hypothetical protein [Aminobacter anthyllidis]MDH4985041.1 hypothetical protein [Aminobacter anthyllidis]